MVLYDPTGQPIEQQTDGGMQQGQREQGRVAPAGEQATSGQGDGSAPAGQPGGGSAGGDAGSRPGEGNGPSETSSEQSQNN